MIKLMLLKQQMKIDNKMKQNIIIFESFENKITKVEE